MAQTALRRGSQEEGNSDYFTGCPIGGGFMWYGLPSKIPTNCRICDNSTLAIASFAKLSENLGGAWGTSGGNLNLPDLRGRFPRGVADGSTNDPDRASRTAANTGGNTGDAVGSVQADIVGQHNHNLRGDSGTALPAGSGQSPPRITQAYNSTHTTDTTGPSGIGNETRPKNANVYFVIRVS